MAALLNEQCRGKLPGAPIFTDATGAAWDRFTWRDAVNAAVAVAGLPVEASAYTLRHSLLTRLVEAGKPLAVVASIAGTSVAQIEASYFHLSDDGAVEALAL